MMNTTEIKNLLEKIRKVKIAVYGDFCLDAYWILDPRGSEISVETGLKANAVNKQSYTLGGASNVVANLAALDPAEIRMFGVVGDDIFGREMLRKLNALGVDTRGVILQKNNFDTYTFCKHYLEGEEQPRYDFGMYNMRTEETDIKILQGLSNALPEMDVVILNQQVPDSITNTSFLELINQLIAEYQDKMFVLDSRHFADKFKNISMKLNEVEAALLNGIEAARNDVFKLSDVKQFAQNLFKKHHKPIFVSRGNRGIIAVDAKGIYEVPGIQLLKKIDPVGAGDTMLSAIACVLAADASTDQAIEFANYAAAVTVQKLFQTGVATGREIIDISSDADFIYQPELAEDIRQAQYIPDSEIEICYEQITIPTHQIKHAVFDHDGTISALRQGWELVMEPVMIKAILGDHYECADERLYHKVVNRVREFIDKSTGIQTVVQMEGLIEMVKEFNLVPQEKILDKFGYKKIYNDALMETVNLRMRKLKCKELNVSDFTIKGSVQFLKSLQERGVTLYLASGTDVEDVQTEAKALGYAHLFNGGIYGAVGDINKYSKKIVIENIITNNKLHGSELVTFGDGPVEMRECRKKDGISVGIASDEIRRHSLNPEKRIRLIKAGAHIIIPDFSQSSQLLRLLFQ